jgi:hypothetical protein
LSIVPKPAPLPGPAGNAPYQGAVPPSAQALRVTMLRIWASPLRTANSAWPQCPTEPATGVIPDDLAAGRGPSEPAMYQAISIGRPASRMPSESGARMASSACEEMALEQYRPDCVPAPGAPRGGGSRHFRSGAIPAKWVFLRGQSAVAIGGLVLVVAAAVSGAAPSTDVRVVAAAPTAIEKIRACRWTETVSTPARRRCHRARELSTSPPVEPG